LRSTKHRRLLAAVAAIAGLSLVAAACGDDDDTDTSNTEAPSGDSTATTTGDGGGTDYTGLSGSISIDGSSTVEPLSALAAEDFQDATDGGVSVTVGTSGTGGGFEKFCNGETDISDASRPIKEEEIAACEAKGIEYVEVLVANDALSVVVNPDNDWAECLTVEQLNTIWGPDSTVSNWNEVDSSFPDQELTLFGAGTDSGTFDYFTAEINGEEGASRTDYNPSEDDNVTVTGVAGDEGAMGYFGFSYLLENEDKVKGVEIDGGDGCVAPSAEAVQDGTYTPLARPLFIYVSKEAAARPAVVGFVEYYVANLDALSEEALFVGLTDEQKTEAAAEVEELKALG
jgi:phosphate transport system substrate-binding protein